MSGAQDIVHDVEAVSPDSSVAYRERLSLFDVRSMATRKIMSVDRMPLIKHAPE